jgi:hypothetical protein
MSLTFSLPFSLLIDYPIASFRVAGTAEAEDPGSGKQASSVQFGAVRYTQRCDAELHGCTAATCITDKQASKPGKENAG